MLLFWRVHQTNGFVGKARCCRLLQLASTLGLTKTCHLFPEMQFNTMQIQTCNQNLFFEDYSLHLNGRVLIIFITGYCWHANNFAFLGWRWSPEKLRKMQVFGWTRLSVSWTQWIIVPQDLFEFWEINLNDKWNNFHTPSLWKQRMKQIENAFDMRWTWGRELQNLGLMSCDSSKKWYSKFNCHEWCSQLQGPSLISHCQKKIDVSSQPSQPCKHHLCCALAGSDLIQETDLFENLSQQRSLWLQKSVFWVRAWELSHMSCVSHTLTIPSYPW